MRSLVLLLVVLALFAREQLPCMIRIPSLPDPHPAMTRTPEHPIATLEPSNEDQDPWHCAILELQSKDESRVSEEREAAKSGSLTTPVQRLFVQVLLADDADGSFAF
jgi:hypothetical protein